MLITPEYREIQRKLHEIKPNYGICGAEYVKQVLEVSDQMKSRDILDYGCGKRKLEEALGFPIRNFDPAIPGLDEEPEPADILVCTDVLEHIEPECLDEVLAHLKSLTKRCAILTVCVVPANKHFPDGRNLHLIIQPMRWWMDKIQEKFRLLQFNDLDTVGFFVCK